MPFELQILHASDFEAGISALDDAPRFSAVINALKNDYENTLILSSGDTYIPGAFFSAASDPSLSTVLGATGVGRADIAILNEIGIQASAFGNHEFDLGNSTIDSLINSSGGDSGYKGALFPYLSSNLDFSGDSNLSDEVVPEGQAPVANSISKSVVFTVGGEQVGVVGATTPTLPRISSPGGVTAIPGAFENEPTSAQLDALAAEIQKSVDALVAQGINKIVLLTHMQQISIEQELAKRLTDVDVIIAGGSNTLLSDKSDRLRPGDERAGRYPLTVTNSEGKTVLVVNTDGNYKYVGRLVLEFDDNGVVDTEALDRDINGAYATDEQGVTALGAEAVADPEVVAITDALRAVITQKDGNIFGKTSVFLNGTRNDVRTQETNLGNLTADANLAYAKAIDETVVISIKNGGGIRDNIGRIKAAPGAVDANDILKLPTARNDLANKKPGDVSQLDIENSLRFNNALSLVTVTAAQLKEVMEHAVAGVADGATPGQFPQVGGISFSFDPTKAARNVSTDTPGERIQSIAITGENGQIIDVVVANGEVVGDPNRTFRLVTLSFLAAGGDSYPFNTFDLEGLDRVDLASADSNAPRNGDATFAADGTEQDAFAEFLSDRFGANNPFTKADVGRRKDKRIQNLEVREDAVFGTSISRGNKDNTIIGTAAKDYIQAGGGNDTVRAGAAQDVVLGGEGNDELFGGQGKDFMVGNAGDDIIRGGNGSDTLYGDAGADTLAGNLGDDLLRGGAGNDSLKGGAGNDTFVLAATEGTDVISDLNVSNDKIGLSGGLTFADLTIAAVGSDTTIALTGTNEVLARLTGVASGTVTASLFVQA